ncbi:MAG: 5'/3'-nucleotidase SurE [Proteobacteria bacterium]|nr:5'/3'-nucleotidase SurE [Pseudomonadota bacterium]
MTQQTRPLILVTNDDGVLSDGLSRLAEALRAVGEVVICAPSRQQSAVSHGISLHEPLRVRTLGPQRYAVTGTPADAVFLALCEICPRRPDLVVSGINHGTNLGTDVFYSGTVAAAVEAALRGIPALAISLQLPSIPDVSPQDSEEWQKANPWDPLEHLSPALDGLLRETAEFAAGLARAVLARPLPPRVVLNVNAPNRPSRAFYLTHLGQRMYRGCVERRVDPRGAPYYWLGNTLEDAPDPVGSDSWALAAGCYSVTPVRLDWNMTPAFGWGAEVPGFTRLLSSAAGGAGGQGS